MLIYRIFIFLACISFCKGVTAQVIVFPYDTNHVAVDGVLNASEWQHADKIAIPVSASDSVVVMFKHDMSCMYFAYTGKLESASALFPELVFDPAKLRSSGWVSGQWWLHVSATDCEHNGAYGVYDNCQLVQPGWEGAPNFTMGAPMTDTVEVKVPFSKIGFNPLIQDTMGISMLVSNTATIFKLWPATADRNVPGTWGKAVFNKFPADIQATGDRKNTIDVFPNPAGKWINIKNARTGAQLSIRDVTGKTVYNMILTSKEDRIATEQLQRGIYFIHVQDEASVQIIRLSVTGQ